ncbi:hypothetical protein, variant [Aphanomyces invadans]|uniref:U2A'/phosphoprotein 32 family A C-terminal domain-containing protein n=1 Tax=Aphanomyces invadans TaxID=157072 RepID=A0A024U685_9STRA|nr:hypothetical protein, variant [Aphanomyces invadans]ETW01789.1 hypothetical protein, variant [Aphanomyces invadans]|eukprot:XP_008869637.1 hypothetical protein, variant [Aphanomyces invadans]
METLPRRRKKKRSHATITMMDVIKSNGMRVVEGTKLNLVAKGIDSIGPVVAAIAQTTTCLYLSQNNIASLDGLTQFTRLKVLSLGGNLLSRFDEFDFLAPQLPSLRTLLLTGNPLCDAPNYRFRIISALSMVHTLDGTDVTPKEREIAPFLVAQDASLRHVVYDNHMEISRLEWIVLLIPMHKEFYHIVFNAHGSSLRCHDRRPQLEKMAVDVALLLRLMKHVDSETKPTPVELYHRQVENQLQRVVVRAYSHLQHHPLRKAKQLLQKFGNQRLKNVEPPPPPSWEDAYASVISLQQNTMAKLRGLCERNRRDLVDALKSLVIRDPGHRLHNARYEHEQRRQDLTFEREQLLREYQNQCDRQALKPNDWNSHPGLPPQLLDPDDARRHCLPNTTPVSRFPAHNHCPTKSPDQPSRCTTNRHAQHSPPPPPPAPLSGDLQRGRSKRTHEKLIAKVFQLDDNVPSADESADAMSVPPTLLHVPTESVCKRRQLEVLEKRRTDLDISQDEKRRFRRDETAPLDHTLRDLHNTLHDRSGKVTPFGTTHIESDACQHVQAWPTDSTLPHAAPSRPPKDFGAMTPADAPVPSCMALNASNQTTTMQWPHADTMDVEPPVTPRPSAAHFDAAAPTDHRATGATVSTKNRCTTTPQSATRSSNSPLVVKNPRAPRPKSVGRVFHAWRQFVEVHQKLDTQQFQRLRRYSRHVLASWRHYCNQQLRLRIFATYRDHRSLLRCFHRWANASRFHAIAAFAVARRDKARLQKLMQVWKQWTDQAASIRLAQEREHHRRTCQMLRRVMGAWRRCTHVHLLHRIHERQLRRVHAKYTLHVVFHGWRRWFDRNVQPRHHLELTVRTTRVRRNIREAFRAWKALVAVACRFHKRTSLVAWRQWQMWVERRRQKARATRRIDRYIVKKAMMRWASLTRAQKHRARMVAITRRQWVHHKLRQVWRHWTTYKSMRRKYVQGCLKAFKHRRIKLERRVWHAWATATATHLHARKKQKQATLAEAFHGFRRAVCKQHARRDVDRRTSHLATRHAHHWVQQCMTRWRVFALQRRKPYGLMRFASSLRSHALLGRLWTCWRTQYTQVLQTRLQTADAKAAQNVAERSRVMAEMLQLNDTTIQLAEQVSTWKATSKEKDESIRTWQQSHDKIDQANAVLQQRVVALQQRLQDMEQARLDQERLDEADRTQYAEHVGAVEATNEGLRRQLRNSQDALLQTQQQLTREREKHQRHNDDKKKLQLQLDQKVDEMAKLQRSLQRVEDTLAVERAERQDAAARCKDYEMRLADTVRAIQEHEADQDNQLRQTHDVALDMERRWKEAEAKNTELVKLLDEKNNCVAALTSQVQTHRSVEAHRVSALLEEVQANIQKNQLKTQCQLDQHVVEPYAQDDMHELNAHTATIHDDIKALQNRIMRRLQQTPLDTVAATTRQGMVSHDVPKGKARGGLKASTKPQAKPKPK